MNNASLINQDSGNFEYYTPTEIVCAARRVMGGIDLDPASSAKANDRVKASEYFSDNGLDRVWRGRVWMNHPFSRNGNPLWIRKAVDSWEQGTAHQLICICFAATSERWFRPLMDFPQCYLSPRTNYYLPDGTKKRGVTKGSVVTYMGQSIAAFVREFGSRGKCVRPMI